MGSDNDRAVGHALEGGASIGRGAGLDEDGPQVVAMQALIELYFATPLHFLDAAEPLSLGSVGKSCSRSGRSGLIVTW